MAKLTVTTFVTLDGVMQAPGGREEDTSGGFEQGGWVMPLWDDAIDAFVAEVFDADALLLGRVTYEGFAAAWPSREGEFADKFNTMPKYVVSSTLREPEWNNTTVLSGDLVEEVTKVRDSTDGDLYVHGSMQLAQALLEHDLVDALTLMVFPVVLGTGKRLFGETTDKKPLKLVDSKIVGDGVAILIYRPERGEQS